MDRLRPTGTPHNISLAYSVTGPLNSDALGRSCREIVRRHEILRTHVDVRDAEPVQIVEARTRFHMDEEDLRGVPAEDRHAAVAQCIEEEAAYRFDLTSGPLFRVRLLRLTATEHVLILTLHHFIADGWSIGVLMRELIALYAAYEHAYDSPLPALPVQYADYAVWQRQCLQGDRLERQLKYWRERLAGAPPILELPADRARPVTRTYRSATSRFVLSESLSARLRQLARRERATDFMVLLAVFQMVLARWSGQHDIVVGTPVAGRIDHQLEALIGCFVNTLALRTDLSGHSSFAELLRRGKQVVVGAYTHQDLPFERLIQALQPRREVAHEPIVQIMIAEMQERRETLDAGSVRMSRLPSHGLSHFDFILNVNSRSDRVRGNVGYSTELFDATTIEAFIAQFTQTLEHVTEKPETPIDTASLLITTERAQLLGTWNATRAAEPDTECVHRLFEARAARSPDAIAAVDATQQLTYAALAARANALAHYLRALNLRPEARVAVWLTRQTDVLVAILAVLEAGGAYVPIDPGWPAARVARILDESRPVVILTESSLRATAAAAARPATAIELDATPCPWAAYPTSPPLNRRFDTLDRAAYVIYTSGSTGTPNGVVVEHRGVVNVFRAMRDLVELTANDVVLSVTTIAFDIAVIELLLPLIVGARTTIVDRPDTIDPARLEEAISRYGVSVAQTTPAMWRMLLDRGWTGGSGLRVMCGGEALPVDLAARLCARVARLWNCYGPTETTVWSIVHPVDAASLDVPGSVSIGRPLRNTRVYILDPAGHLAAIGVPGEIHIGGDGVARAYLNQPAKTAERFIPDPFDSTKGARMYRTGDIGRWRRDGTIQFMGRRDSQVKVHGYRIELGDVESHIKKHSQVRDAVVVVREDVPGERRLVAYYVANGHAVHQPHAPKQDAQHLRQSLAAHLPEYMIPTAFVRLEAMPLTANGKIDRHALPPLTYESVSRHDYENPRGPIEDALASMWAQVLNLDRVGRHDDFFEIGGDSMSALKVVTRIETELAAQLPLIVLFSARTVAELAEHVGAVSS